MNNLIPCNGVLLHVDIQLRIPTLAMRKQTKKIQLKGAVGYEVRNERDSIEFHSHGFSCEGFSPTRHTQTGRSRETTNIHAVAHSDTAITLTVFIYTRSAGDLSLSDFEIDKQNESTTQQMNISNAHQPNHCKTTQCHPP